MSGERGANLEKKSECPALLYVAINNTFCEDKCPDVYVKYMYIYMCIFSEQFVSIYQTFYLFMFGVAPCDICVRICLKGI